MGSDWVIPLGFPTDEYDCLLWPLMRMLENNKSVEALVAFLETELSDHFGLGPHDHHTEAFARRAKTWYEERWHGTTV